jgi:hypothetical protein
MQHASYSTPSKKLIGGTNPSFYRAMEGEIQLAICFQLAQRKRLDHRESHTSSQ